MRISIENEENKERLQMAPEALKLKALASQLDQWAGTYGDRETQTAQTEPAPIVKPKARRGRPRKTDSVKP